jgi:hypothetical protein
MLLFLPAFALVYFIYVFWLNADVCFFSECGSRFASQKLKGEQVCGCETLASLPLSFALWRLEEYVRRYIELRMSVLRREPPKRRDVFF